MCVTPPGECRQPPAAEPSTQSVDDDDMSSFGSTAAGTSARELRIHRRNVRFGKHCRREWKLVPGRAACAGIVALVLCVALASPAVAAPHVVALAASLTDVLNNIRNWLVGLLASLATVFFTVGGVRYLAADGDPGEIGKAKQAFKSAALGYALAALAPILVEILKGIVGAE
jgi:hypothetical protein